jgi:ATP-dependent Clp protease ATP-binding subunit ClpA
MTATAAARKLDPNLNNNLNKLLTRQFANKVVSQDKAVQVLLDMVDSYRAGFCDSRRPAGNALFLGPTGTGKTHVVETLAESLFGNRKACLRIDCAEFQHSHEVSKLIGSPPGYLGHRETHPAIEQERLDKYHTEALKLSIVLFDEIEKASDALWSLLLGILDNGTLTLGDNSVVDLTKTLIILTSNLGAREMANRGIGFVEPSEERDQARLEQVALSAAKSKFSPEFMNRIENIVTFKTLTKKDIEQILEIELFELAHRLTMTNLDRTAPCPFAIRVSPAARRELLNEGWSKEYGARHLKRVIDKRIMKPLAKIFNSGQIASGDIIIVDYKEVFDFYVQPRPTIIPMEGATQL